MKKSLLLTAVFSLVFSSSLFSNTIKSVGSSKTYKAAPVLSSAEQEFLNELDDFYFETFIKPANDLVQGVIEDTQIKKVVVFNIEGEDLATETEEIPVNANYLMEDDEKVYYIVY